MKHYTENNTECYTEYGNKDVFSVDVAAYLIVIEAKHLECCNFSGSFNNVDV